MLTSDVSGAVDRAIHAGVGLGELNALVRLAARGASTTTAVDAFAAAVARYYADTSDPNLTAAMVRTALETA